MGIPFDVIDRTNIQDFGDVLAYWKEDNAAEKALANSRGSKGGK